MSDHLDEPHDRNKLRTQTGDRRAIYFLERTIDATENGRKTDEKRLGMGEKRLVICAEPFAGALAVRGAASGVNLTGYGTANDAVTATIQAVDARAAAVRLFEDAAHEYCKRYQDGSLSLTEYVTRLDNITRWAFEALATKPPTAAESGASPVPGKSTPLPPTTPPPPNPKGQ